MSETSFKVDVDAQLPRNLWSELVRYRASGCEGEGPHNGALNAHHVNQDPSDNRLSNGRSLCIACHRRVHQIGRVLPQEQRDKIAASHRGKTISPEHAAKIGDALRGRFPDEATRQKMSESQTKRRERERQSR